MLAVLAATDFDDSTIGGSSNIKTNLNWTLNGLEDPGDMAAFNEGGGAQAIFDGNTFVQDIFIPGLNVGNTNSFWTTDVSLTVAAGSNVTLEDVTFNSVSVSGGQVENVNRRNDYTVTLIDPSAAIVEEITIGDTSAGTGDGQPLVTFDFADVDLSDPGTYILRIKGGDFVDPGETGNHTGLDNLSINGTVTSSTSFNAVDDDFTTSDPTDEDTVLNIPAPGVVENDIGVGLTGELGVLDLFANGGINPQTGNPWAEGDQYRLVFVTSGTTQATSTDINFYNDFVQNAANAAGLGDASWTVVASTETVNVRTNTGTTGTGGETIFLIDGSTVVANNYGDLWDGNIDNGINLDENGNLRDAVTVFTGTENNGTTVASRWLGTTTPDNGQLRVETGRSGDTARAWTRVFNSAPTSSQSVYALSEVLTVASAGDAVITAFDATSTFGAAVNVNADGSFSYDPTGSAFLQALDDGQMETDTFTYTLRGSAPPVPYADVVAADNPFLWYRFEEGSGATTAVNSGSLAAADGTYSGVTLGEASANPALGNAGLFEGNDDRIEVPDLGGYDQLSIETWINIDGLAGGCCTSIYSTDAFNANGLHYNIKGGRDIEHAMGNGNPNNVNSPGGVIQNDTWYHVVTTYDSLNGGDVEVYINGVSVGTNVAGHASANTINLIASEVGAWNMTREFLGHMDEFALYGTILDAGQVLAHYEAGIGVGSATDTATVSIRVNGVSDFTAVDDSYDVGLTAGAFTPFVVADGPTDLLSNDANVQPITVDSIESTQSGGPQTVTGNATILTDQGASVTVNEDGSFSYDASGSATIQALDNSILTDSFQYTMTDGTNSSTGTVTINVLVTSPPSPGDVAVFAAGTAGESVSTTDLVHDFETEVRRSGSHVLGPNGEDISLAAGHHLIIYNARFDKDPTGLGTEDRSEIQSNLNLAGQDLATGWSQGYIRVQNGQNSTITAGGGIIDVQNAGDVLQLQSFRTDTDTNDTTRGADTGIQLIKLDDSWDYLSLAGHDGSGTDQSIPNDTVNWTSVEYDQQNELDTGSFDYTAGTGITLKQSGHYLVFANTYGQNASSRTAILQRLNLDGNEVEGSKTSVYMRGNDINQLTDEGAASIGMILETTAANQILNVEIQQDVGRDNMTIAGDRTGITIVKLPDNAEFVRLLDNSGDQNLNTATPTVLNYDDAGSQLEVDTAFSHSISTNPGQVSVANDGDYLFLAAQYDSDDGVQRGFYNQGWQVNGTGGLSTEGQTGQYSRNTGGADQFGNWSGYVTGLQAGDFVETLTQGIGNVDANVNNADVLALQGVSLASLFVPAVEAVDDDYTATDPIDEDSVLNIDAFGVLANDVPGPIPPGPPALISNVTIEDVSSELTTNFDRDADYVLDGSGLNGSGEHGNTPDGFMWLNTNNGCCGDPADPTGPGAAAVITFDLGANYDLENFHVWNYNEVNLPGRGANLVEILVTDTTGGTFTSLGNFNFAQASGQADYTGETIDLSSFAAADDTRLIRFNIQSNHGGDNDFIGLSEVQFFSAGAPAMPGVDISAFDAASVNGAAVTVNADGSFSYDPTGSATIQALTASGANSSVTDTFTYTIDDGMGSQSTATVSLLVNGQNDDPVSMDVSINATADSTVDGNFDADDVDSDDDPSSLTYAIATPPSEGSVISNGDGTFTFDPGTDFDDLPQGVPSTPVTFTYTAEDSNNGISVPSTVTVTVTGVNDDPTVTADNATPTVDEGQTATNSGTFADVDTGSTVTISASAGNLTQDDTLGTWSWSFDSDDGPDDSQTITITADDGQGGTATVTFDLVVNNVAPTASITGPTEGQVDTPAIFTFDATDPSADDQAAGFTFNVDWGDGTVETIPLADSTHTYTAAGQYTITVSATDEDGDQGPDVTHVIDVSADPVVLVGEDIVVTGTDASDRIVFSAVNGGFRVRFNNEFYPLDGSIYSVNAGTQLIVNGNEGSDTVIVHGTIGAPAVFDGGEGNDYLAGGTDDDTLIGGPGNDVLLGGEGDNRMEGGDGNDRIEGRSGIDVIFGGTGNDRLNGGGGNDILDGGTDNDVLFGGLGDDLLAGRDGSDTLNGYYGNDVLYGGSGVDQLFGGSDNDLLFGGLGADRLRGDRGDDSLIGGTSALEVDTEASLDDLLATGALLPSVQTGIDAWFASQGEASRMLYEPFGDDGTADELIGGTGADTFQTGTTDYLRDAGSGDTVLP